MFAFYIDHRSTPACSFGVPEANVQKGSAGLCKKKIVEHFEQTPTRTFLSNEVQSDSHVSRSMHCNIQKKVVINEKYGVCCMKNILGISFIIVDLFYVLDISKLSLVFVS